MLAAIGLIAPISQIWPVDESIDSVVLLIGLAVGVDYSMFYLRREREERAPGLSESASLEAAAATSGRAVLVSGLTVMIAMAGMFLAGDPTFRSFATGTILVVAVAMLGSLTVLPAVLATLGDRVEKARIPFLASPEERAGGEPRIWGALLDPVLRRPAISAGLAAALLLVLTLPALSCTRRCPASSAAPGPASDQDLQPRSRTAFPGGQVPATRGRRPTTSAPRRSQRSNGRPARRRSPTRETSAPPIIAASTADRRSPSSTIPIEGDGTDAPRRGAREPARPT